MNLTSSGWRFGAYALMLGCGAAPVHVIGGTNDAYKCGPDQGAFLARNGRAVCMSAGVAEFTTCAMALAAGEDESVTSSDLGGGLSLQGLGSAQLTGKERQTLINRESAAAEVLRSRAKALDACRLILISNYDLKEGSDSESKAVHSTETRLDGAATDNPSQTATGQ